MPRLFGTISVKTDAQGRFEFPASDSFGDGSSLKVSLRSLDHEMLESHARQASDSRLELTVLARSRLGARSEVVVVEFGGAVTMLGVTESQITCLQTLPDTLVTKPAEHPTVTLAEQDPFDDTNPGQPVGFAAHLERGLRDAASPAVELAEQTPDRTSLRHAGKRKHLVDIEGQAAGLAQRLQRRESGG